MTFLAIDHSSNLEDGLYTGEEVCAMLGELEGLAVGLAHIGVEMELDPEILSLTDSAFEEVYGGADGETTAPVKEQQQQRDGGARPKAAKVNNNNKANGNNNNKKQKKPRNNRPAAVDAAVAATIGKAAVNNTLSKQTMMGSKLQILKLRMLSRATAKMSYRVKVKAITAPLRPGPLPSPNVQNVLRMNAQVDKQQQQQQQQASNNNRRGDHRGSSNLDNKPSSPNINRKRAESVGSTCPSSQGGASIATESYESSINLGSPSSITASTCDFAPETNDVEVLNRYRATNPWDAARRGDYATLRYIASRDGNDRHVWTQVDARGNVPLYYACAHYASSPDEGTMSPAAFGQYGLESIRLLADAWPDGVELPRALLEQCARRNSPIHGDVLEVLSSSNKSRIVERIYRSRPRPSVFSAPGEPGRSAVKIDGVADVVPVSFLEDLGDDGYVEDY